MEKQHDFSVRKYYTSCMFLLTFNSLWALTLNLAQNTDIYSCGSHPVGQDTFGDHISGILCIRYLQWFITLAKLQLRCSNQIILWRGIITTWIVLKGPSIRKVETLCTIECQSRQCWRFPGKCKGTPKQQQTLGPLIGCGSPPNPHWEVGTGTLPLLHVLPSYIPQPCQRFLSPWWESGHLLWLFKGQVLLVSHLITPHDLPVYTIKLTLIPNLIGLRPRRFLELPHMCLWEPSQRALTKAEDTVNVGAGWNMVGCWGRAWKLSVNSFPLCFLPDGVTDCVVPHCLSDWRKASGTEQAGPFFLLAYLPDILLQQWEDLSANPSSFVLSYVLSFREISTDVCVVRAACADSWSTHKTSFSPKSCYSKLYKHLKCSYR